MRLRSGEQMAGRVQHYRAELKQRRGEWEPYLKANSGLPGPRANLELVTAVGEEADPDLLWRLSASSDEFLALCGTAGLGRLATTEPDTVLPWLKEHVAAHHGDGGLVAGWSAGAASGGRRTLRAGVTEEAR
jgi:hypothetical protein